MRRTSASRRAVSVLTAAALVWAAPGGAAHAAAAHVAVPAPFAGAGRPVVVLPALAPNLAPSISVAPALAAPSLMTPSALPAPVAAARAASPATMFPGAASVAPEPRASMASAGEGAAAPNDAEPSLRPASFFDGQRPGAAAGSAREPFVPATRVVAELEKLAQTDAEKGFSRALALLVDGAETRREVKLAALRVLDAHPISRLLPLYASALRSVAPKAVQDRKAAGIDSAWYIQRTMILRLAREPEAVKASPEALEALKAAYRDRNPSVRLAAAEGLRRAGVEPGPEASYSEPAPPRAAASSRAEAPQKPARWKMRVMLGVSLAMLAAAVYTTVDSVKRAPAPRPAAVQVVPGSPAAAPPVARAEKPGSPEERSARAAERAAQAAERVAKSIEAQTAAQKNASTSLLGGLFGMIFNAAIFVGIFMLISRLISKRGAQSPGGLSASTSAKTNVEKPLQRFTDVEGVDESLVEVREIVDFLRDPARFKRLGARAPKGVLLEGPPGTGKTLLARALAGETDSAFFALSGSDFVELFVGMGARRVRELFEKARGHRPAVIFIDEIDAMGKARGGAASGSNDEREQTINALLTAMDGFDNSGGIIVVAATNRADTLDPALLRPGRFDRKIHMGAPHMGGREAILTIHAKDKRLSPDLDLRYVARRTAGLAGADLANILNEAALQAVRRGADAVGLADIDEAVDRGTIGAKRSLPMSEALKRRIAYHESGHVLANLLNEDPEVRQPVNKFTIVPHGSGALGFAEMGSAEGDAYLYTRAQLEAKLDHALGGLVAEKLVFGKTEPVPGDWSTGPGSDLEYATNIARAMVQTLGMGRDTGLAVTAPDRRDPLGRAPFGETVAAKTWEEVNSLLSASEKRVTERLQRNRHVLEALTRTVLEKETLIGEEIQDVVRKAGPVPPDR